MLLVILFCLSICIFVQGQENKTSNSQLILISTPSITNRYYRPSFIEIIKFQINYAKQIMGKNNVIVLADKKTMPYLTGGVPKLVADKLPPENVLEAKIEDIWIRDFGTVHQQKPVKVGYLPLYLDKEWTDFIQDSVITFLKSNGMEIVERKLADKPEYGSKNPLAVDFYPDIKIDGGNVVDDMKSSAIMSSRVIEENPQFNNDSNAIKEVLKRVLGFDNIVIVSTMGNVEEDTTGHADGMVSFIDDNTVAYAGQDDKKLEDKLVSELKAGLGSDLKLVRLPSYFYDERNFDNFLSACGVHANALVTRDYVYMPTFGDDPAGRAKGYTVENDNLAYSLIANNTRKEVVKVPVPNKVCILGGSVRCLSMQIEGPIADKLIEMAKVH